MATSVVFVSLVSVLGLVLCFSSYSIKRKLYLYVRNALIVAFGALFLLTMLLAMPEAGEAASLKGCGLSALWTKLLSTSTWWQIILKILTPMIVALISIFLAQLPQRAYETISSALVAIPLTCGLYITPNVSEGVFILLIVAYTIALIVVGLLLFRTYLCVETAAVGGFLVAVAFKGFYSLSNVTMYVITGVLTLLGAGATILFAVKKDKRAQEDLQ